MALLLVAGPGKPLLDLYEPEAEIEEEEEEEEEEEDVVDKVVVEDLLSTLKFQSFFRKNLSLLSLLSNFSLLP